MMNYLLAGENQCGSEQPGIIDIPDENDESLDGQSNTLSGEICEYSETINHSIWRNM